ncbi:MAG TPA: hypothetical protein DIT99_17610 [Candidatus Latescibacteria bacterium]|nr:hypothetical protein [Candidatus Latescibacterota bacterium]
MLLFFHCDHHLQSRHQTLFDFITSNNLLNSLQHIKRNCWKDIFGPLDWIGIFSDQLPYFQLIRGKPALKNSIP